MDPKTNRPKDWGAIKPETTEALGKMGDKATPDLIFNEGVEAGADAILASQAQTGKTRLVIPPDFQLAAHTFDIRSSLKILTIDGARGQAEYREDHIVRLQPNRYPTQTFQCLLHEILHLVDMVCHIDDLSENAVQTLAAGLCQALMSMGIEPDFNLIPEEKL